MENTIESQTAPRANFHTIDNTFVVLTQNFQREIYLLANTLTSGCNQASKTSRYIRSGNVTLLPRVLLAPSSSGGTAPARYPIRKQCQRGSQRRAKQVGRAQFVRGSLLAWVLQRHCKQRPQTPLPSRRSAHSLQARKVHKNMVIKPIMNAPLPPKQVQH